MWWLPLFAILLGALSCNPAFSGNFASPDAAASAPRDAGRPCINLECQIVSCAADKKTTLTGEVRIPAGTLPLANVVVYIPNEPIVPMQHGASCERCDATLPANPIAHTNTKSDGRFVLENVPSGDNIPLVVQVGKWRRQVTIPHVDPCVTTDLEPDTTRLPRDHLEGDLPKIAVTTGGADALECLLRKIGIVDSEFTPENGSGHVNLFSAEFGADRFDPSYYGGALFTEAPVFWSKLENLAPYDIVLLSCEGDDNETNKSVEARQAMLDYLNMGGRVYASHWHNYWLEFGPPPLSSVATFIHRGDLLSPLTATIDTSTERGGSMADWLMYVHGSTERGMLTLLDAKNTVDSINTSLAQGWIYVPGLRSVQFLSFNTPVGATEPNQCGRMVFTDIHVSSDALFSPPPFPNACGSHGFSPQELALVYMFFDLSSCLTPEIG